MSSFFVKYSVTLHAMLINYDRKTISTGMKYEFETFIHVFENLSGGKSHTCKALLVKTIFSKMDQMAKL